MSKKYVYVDQNRSNGAWSVKTSNSSRASFHTETKSEAIKMGRIVSLRSGRTLVVNEHGGKMQKVDK